MRWNATTHIIITWLYSIVPQLSVVIMFCSKMLSKVRDVNVMSVYIRH
jgi:hypothetical protein